MAPSRIWQGRSRQLAKQQAQRLQPTGTSHARRQTKVREHASSSRQCALSANGSKLSAFRPSHSSDVQDGGPYVMAVRLQCHRTVSARYRTQCGRRCMPIWDGRTTSRKGTSLSGFGGSCSHRTTYPETRFLVACRPTDWSRFQHQGGRTRLIREQVWFGVRCPRANLLRNPARSAVSTFSFYTMLSKNDFGFVMILLRTCHVYGTSEVSGVENMKMA